MTSKEKEEGALKYQEEKNLTQKILSSAKDGNLEELKSTIENLLSNTDLSNEDVFKDFRDAHKRTAIHFAAAEGRRKVIAYILDKAPSSIDWKDEEGATALALAVRCNQFSASQLLLNNGSNANTSTTEGRCPIHDAAKNGSVRTIKLLVEHGVNLNSHGANGTALHAAVSEDQEKVVAELISLGADVNALTPQGLSPLILAVLIRKTSIVKILLEAKAAIDIVIVGGVSALHIAAETGYLEVVQLFLDVRHDESMVIANTRTEHGVTPLQLAAGMGHEDVAIVLQPITRGFENVALQEIMQSESKRVEKETSTQEETTPMKTSSTTTSSSKRQEDQTLSSLEDSVKLPERKDCSESELKKALELKEKGNAAYLNKDYEAAILSYTEALAIDPMDPIFYSNRSAAYLGAQNAEKALEDIILAKKLKNGWSKASFRQGQCLQALKRYEDAACAFWQAMQLEPENKLFKKRFQACVAEGKKEHLEQLNQRKKESNQ